MNQTQRAFLIKKIDESIKIKIDALKHNLPEQPSLNNYLLHAVMSGNFEIRTNDEIKKSIINKALRSKEGDTSWMNNGRGWDSRITIQFRPEEIFIIPEAYNELKKQYDAEVGRINKEIRNLSVQSDALITRIQLASDKTLQTMINEIDDMGNISLMDTKIKMLTQ